MRVVIYDHDDMEPITVITLPDWAQDFLSEIEQKKRGPEITFLLPPRLQPAVFDSAPPMAPIRNPNSTCRIHFEAIYRFDGQTRSVMMWLCTTRDGESALLLKSTFLPGQQAAVNEERRKAFLDGLMAAIRV